MFMQLFTPKIGRPKREAISDRADTETAYCWSLVAHVRWFKKMAFKVAVTNGCVNFNRDFTIQNPIASRFHCKTIVLKKVFNQKLYNIKSTKSVFYTL